MGWWLSEGHVPVIGDVSKRPTIAFPSSAELLIGFQNYPRLKYRPERKQKLITIHITNSQSLRTFDNNAEELGRPSRRTSPEKPPMEGNGS